MTSQSGPHFAIHPLLFTIYYFRPRLFVKADIQRFADFDRRGAKVARGAKKVSD
jgi:hypothetical protein